MLIVGHDSTFEMHLVTLDFRLEPFWVLVRLLHRITSAKWNCKI
jgi:hypothetical protein